MITSLVEYLDSHESFFDSVLFYFTPTIVILFLVLWLLSKNVIALLIIIECLLVGYITDNFTEQTMLVATTGKFIIYGFMIIATKKSPKIALAYITLTLYIIIKYFSAVHLATHNATESYNVAALLYYAYFVLLIPVLYLLIRGLFADGGKGYANRHINNNDFNFYDSSSLYDINQRRFMVYYERRN